MTSHHNVMCKLFVVYTRRDLPLSLPNIIFWFFWSCQKPYCAHSKKVEQTFAPVYQGRQFVLSEMGR